LNATTYRGYAKARDLAKISEPDVFDQTSNPQGTQRDLKPWHARQAHAYALGNVIRETKLRLWPEVILNVRDESVVSAGKAKNGLVEITIHEDKLENRNGVDPQISRVDGNHRLYWASGLKEKDKKKLEPINVEIPFCVTIGLDRKEEAALFRDINANQVRMNTSHLDHLSYVLSEKEKLKSEELALWIAMELYQNTESPFYGRIHLGGRKQKGVKYIFSLRTFKEGIKTLLKESTELSPDKVPFELQARAVSRYWNAVKLTFLQEWENYQFNLLLSYFAYFAWSRLGAVVIDASFRKENPTIEEMKKQLEGLRKNVNWSKDGTFKGYGGKGGGNLAFQILKKYLPIEYELEKSLKKLKE